MSGGFGGGMDAGAGAGADAGTAFCFFVGRGPGHDK